MYIFCVYENINLNYDNKKSLASGDFSTGGRFKGKLRKRLKEMLPDYRTWLGSKAKDLLRDKLIKIYSKEFP